MTKAMKLLKACEELLTIVDDSIFILNVLDQKVKFEGKDIEGSELLKELRRELGEFK